MPPVCNKDCLHCPYPDCINDQLDHEDYQALDQMEREILAPPSRKQRRRAAQQRAYYEANREKVAAYQKAYREANREKVAAYQKAYREANRERMAAQQRAYYEANREKVAAQQVIRARRVASGYTQMELAELIGVTSAAICQWERCKVPANFAKLEAVFPGITKEAAPCPT